MDRKAFWPVVEIYAIEGKVLANINSFYEQNIARVTVASNASCFGVNNGISFKLFKIYIEKSGSRGV